jgi:hypothetical protein
MDHLLKGFSDELTKLAQSPSPGGGNPFRQVKQTAPTRGTAASRARTDANSSRIGAPTRMPSAGSGVQRMTFKSRTPDREYIPSPKQTFKPKPPAPAPKPKRGKGRGKGKGKLKDPGIAFETNRSSRELAEKRHNIKRHAELKRIADIKAKEKPMRMSMPRTSANLGPGKQVGWSAQQAAEARASFARSKALRTAKKAQGNAPLNAPKSSPTTASK